MALLDDVATIAKVAAASLDDVGAAAGKAGAKAIGVVVDDTAVTPSYVAGFAAERELPIIKRIALGSLRNKIVFILPAIMLLSEFLPAAMEPLLMVGGVYLCFEGAEKVYEAALGHSGAHASPDRAEPRPLSGKAHEEAMVSGAIRTDFILSAEIMVIALAEVATQPFASRAIVLVVVALMITALVYGVVGLIVKMDDIGLHLAKSGSGAARGVGRALVIGMPVIMSALSVIGTAAMLWVGGHIIIAGLEHFHYDALAHLVHGASVAAARAVPFASGVVGWLVETLVSGLFGVLVGGVVVALLHLLPKKQQQH